MRLKLGIGSKAKKLLTASSLKEKVLNGESKREPMKNGCDDKSTDLGSKEEDFFDSQTWLDSDCEDDFVSVNGDFLPSRGSTPNYQISTDGTLQLDNIFSADKVSEAKSEPIPTDCKKILAQLLEENRLEEQGIEQNDANDKIKVNGKPDVCNSNGATALPGSPREDLNHQEEKMKKTKQCCLPSLARSLSFGDRRNRKS